MWRALLLTNLSAKRLMPLGLNAPANMKCQGIIVAIGIANLLFASLPLRAQVVEPADSLLQGQALEDVVVKAARSTRSSARVESVELIGESQLIRAACCNLGESFTTNNIFLCSPAPPAGMPHLPDTKDHLPSIEKAPANLMTDACQDIPYT